MFEGPTRPETTLANHEPVEVYHVSMLGAPGVGKAALVSQFKTSDCINAYEGAGMLILFNLVWYQLLKCTFVVEADLGEQSISIILNGIESLLKFSTDNKENKVSFEY